MIGTYNGTDKDGTTTYGGYSTNVVVTQDFGGSGRGGRGGGGLFG